MATKKQECMIIGASPIENEAIFKEFPPEKYYVICAAKYNIVPDLIVGDFDSAKVPPQKNRKVLTLPVKKDVTDTMYAVMKGLAKGFRQFVLLGCLGGPRFDHSLANLEVLQYIRHTKVFLIQDSRLRLTEMKGATVSVFPFGEPRCTVSYKGLLYPMDHETLTSGGVLMGVSNSIVEDAAEIRVYSGTALIVVYQA